MRIECTAVSDVLKAYLLDACPAVPVSVLRTNLAHTKTARLFGPYKSLLCSCCTGKKTWDPLSVGCHTMQIADESSGLAWRRDKAPKMGAPDCCVWM